MSENTSTSTAVEFEKGSWQDNLNKSNILNDRSIKAKKTAGVLLWKGAQQAIETWLPAASSDSGAEGLYAEVLEVMGTSRKGDVSKIKTVAVAVREHSLDLSAFKNLSGAYAEATRLTKTQKQEAAEDHAAEEAVENIEAPKTASTPESAALILLSKGVDGAVVAILDALNGPSGENNEAAHRAFMRAVATEIAARVQAAKPKPEPKPKAEKAGTKAPATAGEKSAPAPAKAKAKPAPKAEPESTEDGPVDDLDAPAEPVAEAKAKPAQRRRAVPVRKG